MTIPVLANEVGVDRLLVDLANAVFEGDTGSAGFVSAVGFTSVAAVLLGAAIFGPLSGFYGIMAVGFGMGALGLAVSTAREGGN